jgi:hypothetical protein
MMILQQTRGALSSGDQCSLDLPFAETKSLTARVGPTPTFTRASTATFVGSDGLIQSAAVNSPRFDHNPITLACKGLLIEESRTNSITGSNAFDGWTRGNATVAASSVSTPEGTANAWKVVGDILLAGHTVTRSFAATSGTTYTASVWLKSAENGFAFVGLTSSGGAFAAAAFISVNLSTGAVTTAVGTPVGATSVSYPNGWFRVSFSLTAIATFSSLIDIRLSRDGSWANRSYLGNGVNGMYCYGAQVEAGAFATSYIPTTTGTAIRSADVCSITGAAFSGFYNQAEGAFSCVSTKPSTNLNSFIVHASDGTFNNAIDMRYNTATQAASIMNVSNVNQFSLFSTISESALVKQSVGYKINDCAYSANSSSVITDTLAGIPPTNRMVIGNAAASGSFYLNGTVSSIRYYKKRLPNAKLQALTK